MLLSPTERAARDLLRPAVATLVLTSLHHSYGAVIYDTPWRHHATFIGMLASAVLYAAYRVARSGRRGLARNAALGALTAGTGILVVLVFGLFEGAYNHVAKNILYFGGLPEDTMMMLFPPPTYEMPNDFVFELTGVLQVVPAALAAVALVRLVRAWHGEGVHP